MNKIINYYCKEKKLKNLNKINKISNKRLLN